jgi:endonuclease/exonuclease/phosphatase family metal-dependent hydrolase
MAPFASAPQPVQVTPDATATKLRVMTYNVNFGLRGERSGIDAIKAGSPDVVFLQETTPEWERALIKDLGATYPHHRFEATRNEWIAGGLGVMSRWPIRTIERLDEGPGPFFAHRVVIDAPGGAFQTLNLHLRPPMSDSGSWVVGFFSTRAHREKEALAHVAKLDPKLPALAVGDFNEEDEGMAIAVFKARGFTSALPLFQPNATTWQWPVGGGTLRFRLDHVMYDQHFRAIAAAVVDQGRSDHAPVWADLERR